MTWFGGTVDGSFYWFDSQAVGMDQSVAKQSDFSATIKQSGRNDAIYAYKPAELGGTWLMPASSLNGQDIETINTWTLADGITWVGFTLNGRTVYMDQRGLSKIADASAVSKTVTILQSGRNDDLFKNVPWHFAGSERYDSAKSLNGQQVVVNKSIRGGNGVTWYQFTVNGQRLWIDAKGTTEKNDVQRNVDYSAVVKQDGRNDGIYEAKPWEYDAKYLRNAREMNGANLEVLKEWTTADGVTWVGFMYGGKMAYMDARGVQKLADAATTNQQVVIDQSAGRADWLFSGTPWNFSGSSWAQPVMNFNGQKVSVTKTLQGSNSTTWYEVSLAGNAYWVDSKATQPVNNVIKTVDYSARVTQSVRHDGIYLNAPWEFESSLIRWAPEMNNADIEVLSEWRTADGVTWVGFMYGGKMAYMDIRGVQKTADAVTVNQQKTINQNGRQDGLYKNTPYNFSNAEYAGSATSLNGRQVTVTKQLKSWEGTTWMLISVNGQAFWIDASGLK